MNNFSVEEALSPGRPRDLKWLKQALQYAIQLEFFTIPPYLTALWSIKEHRCPAAIAIREVVVEEMLHMSLACNMLKSIGGVPELSTAAVVPSYPNHLPGGVKPGLQVALSGFSKQSLETFMAIEEPEKDISMLEGRALEEVFPRIGAFYDAIERAFYDCQPDISRAGQIDGYFGEVRSPGGHDVPKNIGTLADVSAAIALIKDQGEGTSKSPFDSDSGELAHYYRFKEIAVGRKIVFVENRGWVHAGEEVKMPECWPVAQVPAGGYSRDGVPPQTWQSMQEFDEIYTRTLRLLGNAWRLGDQGDFHRALEMMMARLPTLARDIMQVPIANRPFNYSPSFRLFLTSE